MNTYFGTFYTAYMNFAQIHKANNFQKLVFRHNFVPHSTAPCIKGIHMILKKVQLTLWGHTIM
jgi:hypothetical protein